MVLVVPACDMEITPAQLHMHFDTLSSVGMPPSSTVGPPGIQGDVVTGMQGIGVSTPNAAAVAAATIGLASELHIPNGMMFIIGTKSMMFAAGGPSPSTLFLGSTTSVDGAAPKLHWSIAPMETCWGITGAS